MNKKLSYQSVKAALVARESHAASIEKAITTLAANILSFELYREVAFQEYCKLIESVHMREKFLFALGDHAQHRLTISRLLASKGIRLKAITDIWNDRAVELASEIKASNKNAVETLDQGMAQIGEPFLSKGAEQ